MEYDFFVDCHTPEQAKEIAEKLGGQTDSDNTVWVNCKDSKQFLKCCKEIFISHPDLKFGEEENGTWANAQLREKVQNLVNKTRKEKK